MNNLVHSPQQPSPSSTRSYTNALHMELAKCLQLVVPASMTSDDRAGWIAAAADALGDIRPNEIAEVSAEVRRTVTRAAQIVPEIARLVAERRDRRSRYSEWTTPLLPSEKPPKDLMSHRGEPMSEAETAELNGILESLNAAARYRPDGSRYFIDGRTDAQA